MILRSTSTHTDCVIVNFFVRSLWGFVSESFCAAHFQYTYFVWICLFNCLSVSLLARCCRFCLFVPFECGSALRVSLAKTRLTVYRRLDIQNIFRKLVGSISDGLLLGKFLEREPDWRFIARCHFRFQISDILLILTVNLKPNMFVWTIEINRYFPTELTPRESRSPLWFSRRIYFACCALQWTMLCWSS